MAANTNLAYSLSSFEKRREYDGQREAERKKAKLKLVRSSKTFVASLLSLKNICIFALGITALCMMIYNNATLHQIDSEINQVSEDIRLLEAENVRMQGEAIVTISPLAVAEYAQYEMGLKKLDKYQIEYIYLYHDDKIEINIPSEEKHQGVSLKVKINSLVNSIKEYIY